MHVNVLVYYWDEVVDEVENDEFLQNFMIKNKSGPRTDLWGTPYFTEV